MAAGKLPWAPIDRLFPAWDSHDFANALGCDRRSITRWRTEGLTSASADLVATRLGLHVALIDGWEHWPDAVAAETESRAPQRPGQLTLSL